MSWKNRLRKYGFLSIILLIVIVIILFVRIDSQRFDQSPTLGFYRVNPEDYSYILSLLENSGTGFGKELEFKVFDAELDLYSQFKDNPTDILITENFNLSKAWAEVLEPLPEELVKRYPNSTQAYVSFDGDGYLLPMQFDHIEFSYNGGNISSSDSATTIIFSFRELENQLLRLSSNDHYPLMISGANDRDLLDTVSVLSLSIAGVEGYQRLQELISSGLEFNDALDEKLRGERDLSSILSILRSWEKVGILHPEWLRFTREDAVSFLDDELSSAYIMRLSTHRTLSNSLLQKMKESPFPYLSDADRATGLVMPGESIAVFKDSPFAEDILNFFPELISNENQKRLTSFSGLAPATTTAEPLDRQSSAVRLWGAASQYIQTPLTTVSGEWVEDLREYLQRR